MINHKHIVDAALDAATYSILENLELEYDFLDLEIPENKREEIKSIFMEAIEKVESQRIQRHVEWLASKGYKARKE